MCGDPNRKYLYLRQYDRYHYNSDNESGAFNEAELAESVDK